MPISGALVLSDVVQGGQDWLVVACQKCDRRGRYAMARLVERHGETRRLPDLLADLSRDCPRRNTLSLDRCGAIYEGLSRPTA